MKKENFVTLVLGVAAGLLFGTGMCMALLPAWDAFVPGVVTGCTGIVLLLVLVAVRRKMKGRPPVRLNGKTAAAVALAVLGALVLGAGMCMVMAWEIMVPGIAVGVAGIVLLLFLIPLVKGLK